MNPRDLTYFAAVAEHGSVARASEALDLSPPALSKCLQRLKASVGTPLVERYGKGIRLTPAGKALLVRIDPIVQALRDVRREAIEIGAGGLGELRVGTSNTAYPPFLAGVAALSRELPGLCIEVEEAELTPMLQRLQRGDLDIVFNMLRPVPPPGTSQERIGDDEFVVFASRSHPLAKKKSIKLEALADERWVAPLAPVGLRLFWSDAFRKAGLPAPRIALATRTFHARMLVAAEGRLLGFTMKRAFDHSAGKLGLVRLPVPELRWKREFGAITRSGGYLPPSATRLVELVRAGWRPR